MNQPTNSPAVTINLHRGFLSLGRQLAARLPKGLELWDLLLKDLTEKHLRKALPAGEIPVVDLFDRLEQHKAPRAKRTRRVR
jgi:hypothetical protein